MKKLTLSLVVASTLVSSLSAADVKVDTTEESGFKIFDDMKFKGEVRPRFETAQVEANGKDRANAMTARTSLGVNAKLFQVDGLTTYVEGTSVNNFGYTDYNSTANGNTDYDVIVDPQQARVTQAYLDYKINKTLVRVGRQMVNLDDQRFIGAVGWRQMFQTFDAVSVVDNSVENLSLLASYVYGFQGVKAKPTADTNTVLVNAKYKLDPAFNVTGYGYLIADTHDTYGIRFDGKVGVSEGVAVTYDASYAMQKDATMDYDGKDNEKIDATYYNVAVGANVNGVLLGVDYEVLGQADGESTKGFTTPLATLHKFNGWADVFLTSTNSAGLIDVNAKVGYKAKGFGKALAVYHKFNAETGVNKDLGTELDILYTTKIPSVNGLSILLKAAMYTKGDTGIIATANNDKSVAWAQLDYKFKSN